MAESKTSWIKKDNGTVEDPGNDVMWVLRDSRQELGKWLNWEEGSAYVKACNEQNYLGFNDWRLPTKSEVRSLFRNENEYRRITQYILENPRKWAMDKLNGGDGNQVMESPVGYNAEAWMT